MKFQIVFIIWESLRNLYKNAIMPILTLFKSQIIFLVFLAPTSIFCQNQFDAIVVDDMSKEPILFGAVYFIDLDTSILTDFYGMVSIKSNLDSLEVIVKYTGYPIARQFIKRYNSIDTIFLRSPMPGPAVVVAYNPKTISSNKNNNSSVTSSPEEIIKIEAQERIFQYSTERYIANTNCTNYLPLTKSKVGVNTKCSHIISYRKRPQTLKVYDLNQNTTCDFNKQINLQVLLPSIYEIYILRGKAQRHFWFDTSSKRFSKNKKTKFKEPIGVIFIQ